MQISDEELSKIKATAMLSGALTVMSAFKIGLKESSRFVSSMTMDELIEIVDESIQEIKDEAEKL